MNNENIISELTEFEVFLGQMALYIEDAYVSALMDLFRRIPTAISENNTYLSDLQTIQHPLRLRNLHIHPLNLTVTLHTAVSKDKLVKFSV